MRKTGALHRIVALPFSPWASEILVPLGWENILMSLKMYDNHLNRVAFRKYSMTKSEKWAKYYISRRKNATREPQYPRQITPSWDVNIMYAHVVRAVKLTETIGWT